MVVQEYFKQTSQTMLDNYLRPSYTTVLFHYIQLAHRLQCRTALKIQNGRQWAPKWPSGSGKVSKQLSLNKFFDPSTPSMRKVDDEEEKKKREKRK